MENITFELDCKECNGIGSYEAGPMCSAPANVCCGGCYETIECEDCKGNKTYSVSFTIQELKEIIEFHIEGNLIDAHELVMNIL